MCRKFVYGLGLKRIVILLSGYPDSKLHGYPTDSDIIKLYFNIIYNHKLSYLSMCLVFTVLMLTSNTVSSHKHFFDMKIYFRVA